MLKKNPNILFFLMNKIPFSLSSLSEILSKIRITDFRYSFFLHSSCLLHRHSVIIKKNQKVTENKREYDNYISMKANRTPQIKSIMLDGKQSKEMGEILTSNDDNHVSKRNTTQHNTSQYNTA